MKKCSKCNEYKDENQFRICRLYKGMEQGSYVRSECLDCEKKLAKQLREIKKNSPPKPNCCECCGQPTSTLIPDHDHVTGQFRGWLCRNCNQGIGKLGDNITTLQNAIRYLQCSKTSTSFVQKYIQYLKQLFF